MLEHAVEIEPGYALAWAMLGALYCDIHTFGLSPIEAPLALAEDCVQRAITLDQNCQHAHYASAYVGVVTRDHPRVATACHNVFRLNPHAAYLVGAASVYLGITGRYDEAFPLFERSLELNPYHPGWFHFLPWLRAFTEQDFEQALAVAEAHHLNMPTFFWDPLVRAAALGKLGREREAATAVQQLLKLQPDFAARPDFYVGCFVQADETRADVLDGLRVGGLA